MNNVLKTFSVGFCLLSTQSYAASVDILTYFKPGGSTDSHIQQIKPLLEEKGFDADEAKKFFEHYQTRSWQTSDGKEIRDWRAVAINWMDRTEIFDEEKNPNKKQASQIKDNLRTTKNKDYGQPL